MLQNRGNVFRGNSVLTKRTQKSIYAISEIFSNLPCRHTDINSVHNGKTINLVPRNAIQLLKAIKH
jgi:hypothetical protein